MEDLLKQLSDLGIKKLRIDTNHGGNLAEKVLVHGSLNLRSGQTNLFTILKPTLEIALKRILEAQRIESFGPLKVFEDDNGEE
jgi:hypothetical protein